MLAVQILRESCAFPLWNEVFVIYQCICDNENISKIFIIYYYVFYFKLTCAESRRIKKISALVLDENVYYLFYEIPVKHKDEVI